MSDVSIYVLKRDDTVFYVGSTANPSSRKGGHIRAHGEDITMEVVRTCTEDQRVVEESREIAYWADQGCNLVNSGTPSSNNKSGRRKKRKSDLPLNLPPSDIPLRHTYQQMINEEYDRLTRRRWHP